MVTIDSILARTDITPGCWLWRGPRNTKGYGHMFADGRTQMVHRLAYSLHFGAIPNGLVIDHLCHDGSCPGGRCEHRTCVNPSHLRATTNAENLKRQSPAMKTHCIRGHERTDANSYINASGWRGCRLCHAITAKRWQMANPTGINEATVIRAWARGRGIPVSDRGRVSSELKALYEAARATP